MDDVKLNTIGILSAGGGGSAGPKWTGHADAEGLKAIGWTDEDIAYYQENGVNWNAEDDEYHKVTDDNKALYGVLTADNISTYKERIVYLPKIDTSNLSAMNSLFSGCRKMVATPSFAIVGNSLTSTFDGCYSLVCVGQIDISGILYISSAFRYCFSLTRFPPLETGNIQYFSQLFSFCHSLTYVELDMSSANQNGALNVFQQTYALSHLKLKSVKFSLDLSSLSALKKDSLLYIINNEAATSAITIKLASYAYTRLAEDADIVAALANHPNISLASA